MTLITWNCKDKAVKEALDELRYGQKGETIEEALRQYFELNPVSRRRKKREMEMPPETLSDDEL